MPKRDRKIYTETQRTKIMGAAQTEGLTASQVQKRFGVKPVTYYSWRKKLGLKSPRGRRRATQPPHGADPAAQVRDGV